MNASKAQIDANGPTDTIYKNYPKERSKIQLPNIEKEAVALD